MKIKSIKKKVPQRTTLPDGNYIGTHSGYIITIDYKNESYEIEVDNGIRGSIKVMVNIDGDNIITKDLKN
jgi:hypothetical protein